MAHVIKNKRCSTVLKQEKCKVTQNVHFNSQVRLETCQRRKDKSEGIRCKLLQLYIHTSFNIFNVYL